MKNMKRLEPDSNNGWWIWINKYWRNVVPRCMAVRIGRRFMKGKPHTFKGLKTLGLANANQIPWSNVKAMMTTEYCPATEIQRMEQDLWTLTLKGDDIEAYNNRFYELALMCPELVPTEKKKIEKYVRGFPKRIKGNITSSKPATQ
ncbi:putative reverse transcriptase domain-containing protein [Tanacetum coccineum]